MRFSSQIFSAAVLLAPPCLAFWQVETSETGCGDDQMHTLLAGHKKEDMGCQPYVQSHNIRLQGLEQYDMVATLYSDSACWDSAEPSEIVTFQKNGCYVVPATTVIDGVRVGPRV